MYTNLPNTIPIISIHAPAKGATLVGCGVGSGSFYFNPRSREGSDVSVSKAPPPMLVISIHAPAKGATKQADIKLLEIHFNPRSREGSDGYTMPIVCYYLISIHAPAKGATLHKQGTYF